VNCLKSALMIIVILLPSVAIAASGDLQIKCDPSAEIFIDGKHVGTTNKFDGGLFVENLLPGTHKIMAKMSGYYDVKTDVEIVAYKTAYIKVVFEGVKEKIKRFAPEEGPTVTLAGNLELRSAPVGASIFVDGHYKGDSDLLINNTKSGKRNVKFQKGDMVLEGSYIVPVNKTLKLKAHFKKMELINISEIEAMEIGSEGLGSERQIEEAIQIESISKKEEERVNFIAGIFDGVGMLEINLLPSSEGCHIQEKFGFWLYVKDRTNIISHTSLKPFFEYYGNAESKQILHTETREAPTGIVESRTDQFLLKPGMYKMQDYWSRFYAPEIEVAGGNKLKYEMLYNCNVGKFEFSVSNRPISIKELSDFVYKSFLKDNKYEEIRSKLDTLTKRYTVDLGISLDKIKITGNNYSEDINLPKELVAAFNLAYDKVNINMHSINSNRSIGQSSFVAKVTAGDRSLTRKIVDWDYESQKSFKFTIPETYSGLLTNNPTLEILISCANYANLKFEKNVQIVLLPDFEFEQGGIYYAGDYYDELITKLSEYNKNY